MWHPAGEAIPDVDAAVAEQAIDLLDRVFGHQTACLRQGLADHRDGERGPGHDAQCGRSERGYALGVEVVAVQAVNKRADVLQPSALARVRRFHPHDTLIPKVPRSGRESGRIGARPRWKENEGSREGRASNTM